jgi:anti-sigma factor RsiW
MSSTEPATGEHEAFEAQFSDYLEDSLPEAERQKIAAHLEECEGCAAAYEEFKQAMSALSGLHRMSAPENFESRVEETIGRRSGGRFFGRKAFGDRVPFELLGLVALAIVALIYVFLLRASDTGSLRPLEGGADAPEIHERAQDVVPRP